MIKHIIPAFMFFLSITALPLPASAQESDKKIWQDAALAGIGRKDMSHPMPDDLWKGATLAEISTLIHGLPDRFAHPVYRAAFKNILLSPSEGFDTIDADHKGDEVKYKPQDISDQDYLAFLKLRFQKLYDIGAVSEAHKLYDSIFGDDAPQDQDLAIYGLHRYLLKGQLGAACLDVEAMDETLSAQPKIVDIKTFCTAVLAGGEDAQSMDENAADAETEDSSTEEAPAQDAAPAANTQKKNPAYRYFKGLKILQDAQDTVTKNSFEAFTTTEKLLAHAYGKAPWSLYLIDPSQDYSKIPPLSLYLLGVVGGNTPAHSCIMIESYNNGIISGEALILHARSLEFDEKSFESDSALRHAIPACRKPAWYIHWIDMANDDDEKTKRMLATLSYLSDNYPQLIAAYLPVLEELSPSDLKGFERWQIAAAHIKSNTEMGSKWRKSAIDNEGENIYIQPDWYLSVLESPDFFTVDQYMNWLDTGLLALPFQQGFDPAMPLTLLKNMLNLKKYQRAQNRHYEKLFLLTFSRNYVIYNDSLISRIRASVENEHTGKSVLLLLRILGSTKPDDVYPEYLHSLMDLFSRIGYKYYVRHLIVDTLSVGKN